MSAGRRSGICIGALVAALLASGFRAGIAAACQEPVSPAELARGDDRLWGRPGDRRALLEAVDRSLRYLRSSGAAAYARRRGRTGIGRERVIRSLERFRAILRSSRSADQLVAALRREFVFVTPGRASDSADVHFTGYYEPLYEGSLRPSAVYRYPLYGVPPGFGRWRHPNPTRLELEGADGLRGAAGPLRGQEIVWLRDRLEAFLVHVEGSARIRLPDGRVLKVGFAGHTDQPYTSIGMELVRDGKIPFEELTQQRLIAYFRTHPEDLDKYLPRNRRFAFFRRTASGPPMGGVGEPLTAERSIATDKAIMPSGALALVHFDLVNPKAVRVWGARSVTRFVLDQDAGSAIKGPNRVDLFMGSGPEAGERAGVINSTGRLYYLLLR